MCTGKSQMKVDPNEHYEEGYFFPQTRTYLDEFNNEREYRGPAKDWHGFTEIAQWLKLNFPDAHTIYDIGCGPGSFVARASQIGFLCRGIDISKWAIKNCVEGARGRLQVVNIIKENPSHIQHDMVTALDLMEHIYEKDLDKSLDYIYQSIRSEGIFFACIATARNQNEIWTHTSEEDEVPPNKRWLAISGHVNIKFMDYWIKKMESTGLKTDYESMVKFQIWRMQHSELSALDSWSLLNVYIGRKP